MSIRRQGVEIEAEILNICKDGAKKTWIVYKANLNFAIVKAYIEELKRRGQLEELEDIYKTTEEGLDFLREYEAFQKIRYPDWIERTKAYLTRGER